jgi:hypothetical protein
MVATMGVDGDFTIGDAEKIGDAELPDVAMVRAHHITSVPILHGCKYLHRTTSRSHQINIFTASPDVPLISLTLPSFRQPLVIS